ncbi:hypothetical protein OESDEN_02475 [Oesophagostomum dentatum]|uniref:Uncharacterized protein n=1 Tax=Oesophagostomum dentatum TaxID=61180 RepID=A0A0B1TQ67_OESDE|nr:hypothetical protein OESDEN_02475 [Oesophagostomum dentatum]
MNLGNTNADVPRSPQRLFLQDKASENAWPNEQQRRNIARPGQPTTHLWRYGTNRVPLQSQSNRMF